MVKCHGPFFLIEERNMRHCPELLRLQSNGAVCEKVDCPHNLFFVGLRFKRVDTHRSRQFKNCSCLVREDLTLEEIAAMYGVTRERIRQIEEKALQKIRRLVLVGSEKKSLFDGFLSKKQIEEGMRLFKEQEQKD